MRSKAPFFWPFSATGVAQHGQKQYSPFHRMQFFRARRGKLHTDDNQVPCCRRQKSVPLERGTTQVRNSMVIR